MCQSRQVLEATLRSDPRNFWLQTGVIETVRKGLIAAGVVVSVVLTVGYYLPRRGQAALNALEQNRRCDRVIIEWAPNPSGEYLISSCFEKYMQRREEILWRYFFFQTLATHL